MTGGLWAPRSAMWMLEGENKMENTSGQGKAALVPPEVDRWNWGAFLLNWIWGLGNRVYIALLVFIPLVNIVMIFVLGAKGSAWAWRNKRWESVEHFKRVQRLWAIAGVALFVVMIALGVGSYFAVMAMLKDSDAYRLGVAKLQANSAAMDILGPPIETGNPRGSIKVSGPSGDAQLAIPVEGRKSKGQLYLDATKDMGQWKANRIELEIEGRPERIDLNRTTADDLADAITLVKRGDFAKALPLLRRAADAGNPVAQFETGLRYDLGEGVALDYKQAMAWYEKSAAQGHAPAQHNIGVLYDRGQGVAQDPKQAAAWYQKAAAQGLPSSQASLGLLYENGRGVEQDFKKALEWYTKAAENGFSAVLPTLGIMHIEGQGTEKDPAEAYKWWTLAAEDGDGDAKSNLEKLKPDITAEQLAEGQRRVEEWKKTHKATERTPG
jgi:TPR repeat protein